MSGSIDGPRAFASLAELEACLWRMANIPSDEDGLTELEHGLQCADVLQRMAPNDPALQVAGLIHDIGSALGYPQDHGPIGAIAVRGVLGERIAELVRLHIDAKRYLVTVDTEYRSKLSPTSIRTLQLQGGPLGAAESKAFGASPYCNDAIRLRQADDLAKTPGAVTQGLGSWIEVVRRVHGSNFQS